MQRQRHSDEDDLIRGFLGLPPQGQMIVVGIVVLILIGFGIYELVQSHSPSRQKTRRLYPG